MTQLDSMRQWYADMVAAAADLGYIVEKVDYTGSVTLIPNKASDRCRITFEGLFVSGSFLRETLRPVAAK